GNPPRGVALLSRPRGGGADARVGAHAARSRRPVRRVGAVDGDLPRVRDQSRGLRVQPLRRLAARCARPTPAHAIACGPARAYAPPRLSGAAPRLAPPMLDTLRRFGYKFMGLASLSKPQRPRRIGRP